MPWNLSLTSVTAESLSWSSLFSCLSRSISSSEAFFPCSNSLILFSSVAFLSFWLFHAFHVPANLFRKPLASLRSFPISIAIGIFSNIPSETTLLSLRSCTVNRSSFSCMFKSFFIPQLYHIFLYIERKMGVTQGWFFGCFYIKILVFSEGVLRRMRNASLPRRVSALWWLWEKVNSYTWQVS